MMQTKFRQWFGHYKFHVLAWTFYMLYESLSIGFALNSFGRPVIYLAHYAIFILFFYLNANFFLPLALRYRRRLYLTLPAALLFQVIMYITCQFLVSQMLILAKIAHASTQLYAGYILRNTYRAMLYLGFSSGYYFLKTYFNEHQKAQKLERDRLTAVIARQEIAHELTKAQNALLNAQINPHFLFNTLNFIHHQVRENSTAADAIIRLAEMMRYAMDAYAMDEHIQLADEIEQVENLLELHQLKSVRKVNLQFSYAPAVTTLRFIPLVLLTLVENMFKHGDLYGKTTSVLELKITAGQLNIQTLNPINRYAVSRQQQYGLVNTGTRLRYAYGKQVIFNYGTKEDLFIVELSIPLQLLQ